MTEENEKPFDFRELLGRKDRLGRPLHRFPKIEGKAHDPEFGQHLHSALYAIGQHSIGDASAPWAQTMEAYAPALTAPKEAHDHWEHYLISLESLSHALVGAHEDQAKAEPSSHHDILHAWEQVADEVFYFRAARPDLAQSHPLPSRQDFSSAGEGFAVQAMEIIANPPAAAHPKAPTPWGEQRRGNQSFFEMLGPKPSPKDTQPLPRHSSLVVSSAKSESDRVQTAIGMVIDPVSGIHWYKAFQNATEKHAAQLRATTPIESLDQTLDPLTRAARRVETALMIYGEVLRHNFHHPEAQQDEEHPFAALALAAQELRLKLHDAYHQLPNPEQFYDMHDAMKQSATLALTVPEAGPTPRANRGGGGAGYFPGGRR